MATLTLYSDELEEILLENNILEETQNIKIGNIYDIIYNHKKCILEIAGISFGIEENLYTLEIK